MNRKLLIAALSVASFSAKAQTTIEKPIAYSKCGCEPKPFKYEMTPQGESLTVGDTTYFLDWRTHQVVQNGVEYKMEVVTPYKDAIEVEFNGMVITILYDKRKKFLDYIIEK